MTRRIAAAFVVLGALGLARPIAHAADGSLVITGGTLIDGTGGAPVRDAVVVMDNGHFVAAGRRADVTVPAGAREINAQGKFILPGLIDANVHLVLGSSIEFIVRHEGQYEDLIEEAAQVALKNGLTTVFDSWGPLQPLLNVRDRIKRGETVGSRMYVAGNIVGFSGPFGREFNRNAESTASKSLVSRINKVWEENVGPPLLYMSPEDVRTEIRKYIGRGIDFLKYGASTHNNLYLQFSPEAQRAIVEECHKAGIIAQTHTTNVMSLKHAIEAGNDMLQHCDVSGPVPIPDSLLSTLREKNVYCATLPRTRERLRYELSQAADPRAPLNSDVMHFNEIRLIQADAPILLSTDAGMMDPDAAEQSKPEALKERSTTLGDGHFLWFKAMQENGMKPMDAIQAATRNIAAAYHKLDELGTIEKGKRADLIIIDADPLDDLNNIRKISTVVKDGHVVDRGKLPLKRVLTVPRDTHVIITTDAGDIELELDAQRAPKTVENFLKYVDAGYYNGGGFYRTVRSDNQPNEANPIQVVEAGVNPSHRANRFPPIALERTNDTGVWHVEGAVSMARNGPDTAQADFFISLEDTPALDFGGMRNADGQGFAAFGRVVRGLDVVRTIQRSHADAQRLTPDIRIIKIVRAPLGVFQSSPTLVGPGW
jgi:imidazolonepropionase-like amidohydrolase/cyclophilin family peptidyl-prolyl cis-trans isomerase